MIAMPVWILGVGIFVIFLLVVLLWAVWNNWFPPADRGSFIYAFPSDGDRRVATSLFAEVLGMKPRFVANSPLAKRNMYGSGVIFNIPNAQSEEEMGGRTAGYAVVVANPVETANQVRLHLAYDDVSSKVQHDPDPTLPKGCMSFVTWDGCPFVLVLRKSFDKMGPMPDRWQG